MIDDAFITRWIARVRSEIPATQAILLKGSHAREDAGPQSDVDLDVLTLPTDAEAAYLAYLEPNAAGRLVHVSIARQPIDRWLDDEHHPSSWSFGLPSSEATRLLWAANAILRQQLDRPCRRFPPADPELEDFVEGWGKVRNALARQDDLALRLAAQNLARLAPTLLRLVNPEVCPGTHLAALKAALAFPIAPPTYGQDMRACLGLSGQATTITELHDAARRLVLGTLHLLRETPRHTHAFEIGLDESLHDGTLERYVIQDAGR